MRVRGHLAASGATAAITVARPVRESSSVGLQGSSGVDERKARRVPSRSDERGGRITLPLKPVSRAEDPSRASR